MLPINQNSNIDDYRESVIAGLDAKKSIWMILAILSVAGFIVLFAVVIKLPIVISVYGALPVAAPFILTGFSNKDGMSYWQRRKRKKQLINMPILPYISTENRAFYMSQMEKKIIEDRSEEEEEEDFKKLKKKIFLIMGSFVTIVILVFVVIIIVGLKG